jgi:branched-chain amino acid transport system permease protein
MKKRKDLKTVLNDFKSYLRFWIKTFRGQVTVLCLIGLAILPFITTNTYIIGIFNTFMIYTIFAASWDFLAGYVGQVSFGHAIFLGVSAYVTAFTVKFFLFPWWFALILGAFFAVLFGLIVGVPSLRLKGPYLALGTLSMSLILYELFKMSSLGLLWEATFPGTELFGTTGIGQIIIFTDIPQIFYIVIFIIMCVVVVFLTHFVKSNTGTILKAIRDDETGAKASGINTTKYKVIAFMISGFIAGIAGGLFTFRHTGVNPGIFQPLYSFYAIIMAALGGIATISGSALGAFIFVFLGEILRLLGDNPNITGTIGGFVEPIFVFSIILIIIIRFAEHGLLKPALERLKSLWDLILGR